MGLLNLPLLQIQRMVEQFFYVFQTFLPIFEDVFAILGSSEMKITYFLLLEESLNKFKIIHWKIAKPKLGFINFFQASYAK